MIQVLTGLQVCSCMLLCYGLSRNKVLFCPVCSILQTQPVLILGAKYKKTIFTEGIRTMDSQSEVQSHYQLS